MSLGYLHILEKYSKAVVGEDTDHGSKRQKMATPKGNNYSHSRLSTLDDSGYDNLNDLERVTLERNGGIDKNKTYNINNVPKN